MCVEDGKTNQNQLACLHIYQRDECIYQFEEQLTSTFVIEINERRQHSIQVEMTVHMNHPNNFSRFILKKNL